VTYVDTKILIATAIGSSLTRVLLFGKTVLSVDWWKKYIFANSENGRRRQKQQQQQKSEDTSMTFASNHNITESKSQSLVQVKKLSKWNGNYDLINKKVISCEMIDIGYISTVENQFMTIIHNGRSGQQQYVIPTYYVREHDKERVLIDTSVRYLDRYQI
jgi:hypothetical protein